MGPLGQPGRHVDATRVVVTPTALAVRAAGLGDLLVALPALRAVRTALADHHLVLAAPMVLAPVVRGVVDDVVDVRAADNAENLRALGNAPISDVVLNLHGRGPESHLRARERLAPGGRFVAFRRPPVHLAGPSWDESEHEVDRWCRLVGDGLQTRCDPHDIRLPAPTGGRDAHVVVHVSTSKAVKNWPLGNWGAVVRAMRECDQEVFLTGLEADRPRTGQVAAAAGLPPEYDLAGRTSISELVSLVSAARLLVAGDTGVAHLATATGTPSILIFGPRPLTWAPREGPHVVLTARSIADVTVGEVVAACRRILAGRIGTACEQSRPGYLAAHHDSWRRLPK
jgi:ADP-heptose:LPS heptosyltransferase